MSEVCICQICSCGNHRCPHEKLVSSRRKATTTYSNQSVFTKPYSYLDCIPPKPIRPSPHLQIPAAKMDLRTHYQDTFVPKPLQPVYRPPKRQYFAATDKFQDETEYRLNYSPKHTAKAQSMRVARRYERPMTPMETRTSSRTSYPPSNREVTYVASKDPCGGGGGRRGHAQHPCGNVAPVCEEPRHDPCGGGGRSDHAQHPCGNAAPVCEEARHDPCGGGGPWSGDGRGGDRGAAPCPTPYERQRCPEVGEPIGGRILCREERPDRDRYPPCEINRPHPKDTPGLLQMDEAFIPPASALCRDYGPHVGAQPADTSKPCYVPPAILPFYDTTTYQDAYYHKKPERKYKTSPWARPKPCCIRPKPDPNPSLYQDSYSAPDLDTKPYRKPVPYFTFSEDLHYRNTTTTRESYPAPPLDSRPPATFRPIRTFEYPQEAFAQLSTYAADYRGAPGRGYNPPNKPCKSQWQAEMQDRFKCAPTPRRTEYRDRYIYRCGPPPTLPSTRKELYPDCEAENQTDRGDMEVCLFGQPSKSEHAKPCGGAPSKPSPSAYPPCDGPAEPHRRPCPGEEVCGSGGSRTLPRQPYSGVNPCDPFASIRKPPCPRITHTDPPATGADLPCNQRTEEQARPCPCPGDGDGGARILQRQPYSGPFTCDPCARAAKPPCGSKQEKRQPCPGGNQQPRPPCQPCPGDGCKTCQTIAPTPCPGGPTPARPCPSTVRPPCSGGGQNGHRTCPGDDCAGCLTLQPQPYSGYDPAPRPGANARPLACPGGGASKRQVCNGSSSARAPHPTPCPGIGSFISFSAVDCKRSKSL